MKTMIELVRELSDLWEKAEDATDANYTVEHHMIIGVADYTNNVAGFDCRDLLCDLVEKVGREAHAILKEIEGAPGDDPFAKFKTATEEFDKAFVALRQSIASQVIERRDEKVLSLDAWEFNWLSRHAENERVLKLTVADRTRGVEAAGHLQSAARLAALKVKLEALDKP